MTRAASIPDVRFGATARPGLPWSVVVSAMVGFLTPFTISLVGEMPVGECLLMAVCGWLVLCVLLNRAWPADSLREPWLWALMGAQAIAIGAYVLADFYRGSSPGDMLRGWARMGFLTIDVVAIAFLVGCNPRNLLWLLAGGWVGDGASALAFGALFGDYWKFGFALPISSFIVVAAAIAGPVVTVLGAFGMGVVNFVMDFRSLGGLCLLVGACTALHLVPRNLRLVAAPIGGAIALIGIVAVYQSTQNHEEKRSNRSDIQRSAMVLAAWEAFQKSPLIGHGSWFSNTDVYDNYFLIQIESGREAGIGGFAEANSEPGSVALHSQILVALAEGGVGGAAFFFVYAAGLGWALWFLTFQRPWDGLTSIYTMTLLLAVWNLFLSPFSGAHRVYIAVAVGLVLVLLAERRAARERRVEA